MEITNKKIEELAHLARLEFKDTEKVKIKADLERIVGFFDNFCSNFAYIFCFLGNTASSCH